MGTLTGLIEPKISRSYVSHFCPGHSPTSAYEKYRENLKEARPDDFEKIVDDTSLCPTQQWFYSLYYNTYKRKHIDGSETIVDDPAEPNDNNADDDDDDDSNSLTE